MNLAEWVLLKFLALIWMSLFALVLPFFWLLLDIVTGKEPSKLVHEFWMAWFVLTLTFYFLDFFFVWAIRKQKGLDSFKVYPNDYPRWKKIIHYATIGKYSKTIG